jgi:hypothetical protein
LINLVVEAGAFFRGLYKVADQKMEWEGFDLRRKAGTLPTNKTNFPLRY